MSSSIPNFSFTKFVIMLSLSSYVSLVSSWNPSRRRLFRRLRPSKSASFFFVFMTKSSVISSSLISSTLLSMSSSFLLTSSAFSLWYWTLSLKYVNSFLIFEFYFFRISIFLSNISIALLNTFNSVFLWICSNFFSWLNVYVSAFGPINVYSTQNTSAINKFEFEEVYSKKEVNFFVNLRQICLLNLQILISF